MRARLGLAVACAALSFPVAAQDDVLQHDAAAVFEGNVYEAAIGEIFFRDPAVCRGGVQMITVASFVPERSAGTCRRGGLYVAFADAPETPLYGAGMDTTGVGPWSPERARTVAISRTEVRIDSAVAVRIERVWERALGTVRPPAPDDRPEIGTDGEILYFASFAPVSLTAHASNPSPESVPGALRTLGDAVEAVALRRAPSGVLGPACDRVEQALARAERP